jgi:hypothetical protein
MFNFDEPTLNLMLHTAYDMAQQKIRINQILNEDINKCRDLLENVTNVNQMNILKNNLRKMEMLSYKQNGYITNCKLLMTHIHNKIKNPGYSGLPILRYITNLEEC